MPTFWNGLEREWTSERRGDPTRGRGVRGGLRVGAAGGWTADMRVLPFRLSLCLSSESSVAEVTQQKENIKT
jgi:hypothetical protein